jgi:hypothetical protein
MLLASTAGAQHLPRVSTWTTVVISFSFHRSGIDPFLFQGGSSTHTHVSVHSAGGSWPNAPTATNDLTSYEASFLSSLLDHLPAVTALTLPQPASYKRVGDGVWSGGTYVSWGTDNREAPVRLCNANSPSSRNFELRFIDGLANVSAVGLSEEIDTDRSTNSLIWHLQAC